MQRAVVLFLALAVVGAPGRAVAQATSIAPADLAATWQLVSLERGLSSEKPERNQQPRGLLILDSAGTCSSGSEPIRGRSPTLRQTTR